MTDSTALSRYSSTYQAKKAWFTFLGASFRLFTSDGSLAFFVKQKAFKLKEEITVFADEGQKEAMLTIKARSVMDVSAIYDITDVKTGDRIGSMKRKGLKSILRDEWSILSLDEQEVGVVKEDSGIMALVRRFLIKIIPQTFRVTMGDGEVGIIKQTWNIFSLTYDVDFSADTEGKLDARMGVALVVLLLAIEGRQG